MHLSYNLVLQSIFPKFEGFEKLMYTTYKFEKETSIVNVYNNPLMAGFTFILFNPNWPIVNEGLTPPSIQLERKVVSIKVEKVVRAERVGLASDTPTDDSGYRVR